MPFDDVGMSGEGTLKEYFTQGTYEFDLHQHVDRLQLELFSKLSGLDETETMQVFWPDDEYEYLGDDEEKALAVYEGKMKALRKKTRVPGLVMIGIQPDDPILALFKAGKPIAAFYASYRGIYQAGGYVAEGDQHFFAHDFLRDLPMNEWIADYQAGCSEIARDFLLNRRSY